MTGVAAKKSLVVSPETLARIQTMMIQLQKEFPLHFPSDGSLPLPWQRHLWRSIRAYYQKTPLRLTASGTVIKKAMQQWYHQHQYHYLKAMVLNPIRYGLDGESTGIVNPDFVLEAEKTLSHLKKPKS